MKKLRELYYILNNRVLILNFIVQKIFGVSNNCKFSVHFTSLVQGSENIYFPMTDPSILNSFAFSGGCYIRAANGSKITIGEGTIWAFNLNLQTGNHDFKDRNKYLVKDIIIGKNCWIGGNVSILPGVILGDNVVVGANSVVTKKFGSNLVIAGCPAKIIKEL